MLGMGVVFQMPAVTYVLARIGLVTAGFLVRIWKTAMIVIMIAAAVFRQRLMFRTCCYLRRR